MARLAAVGFDRVAVPNTSMSSETSDTNAMDTTDDILKAKKLETLTLENVCLHDENNELRKMIGLLEENCQLRFTLHDHRKRRSQSQPPLRRKEEPEKVTKDEIQQTDSRPHLETKEKIQQTDSIPELKTKEKIQKKDSPPEPQSKEKIQKKDLPPEPQTKEKIQKKDSSPEPQTKEKIQKKDSSPEPQTKEKVHEKDSPPEPQTKEKIQKKDSSPEPHKLTIDPENLQQCQRIVGEIAFQLDRRIICTVFSQFRRLYGFRVSNIEEKIKQVTTCPLNGRVDEDLRSELNLRYQHTMKQLKKLGYDPAVHPNFTEYLVNMYGIMKDRTIGPEACSSFNDPQYLSKIISECMPSDNKEDMMIILNSLVYLAKEDGKCLFIW